MFVAVCKRDEDAAKFAHGVRVCAAEVSVVWKGAHEIQVNLFRVRLVTHLLQTTRCTEGERSRERSKGREVERGRERERERERGERAREVERESECVCV